MDKPDMLATLG